MTDLKLETEAKDLDAAIHQTVGFASMCWENAPTGVFDSDNAHNAALQLKAWIEKNYIAKPADLIKD